jgi:NAD+ kinase
MAKAILFINLKKERAPALASLITAELDRISFKTDPFIFDRSPVFEGGYDIAFSLGGDGTVLYTARCMAPLKVPVFPVNLGNIGFIAAIHPETWKEVFEKWRTSGASMISPRLMLETRVERGSREVFRNNCLNDVVISSSGMAKLIRLDVSLGEGSVFTHLGQYRADGLIAATPTGSTAYSAAAGGPILDPEVEAIILNPICPFTLSHRPLVLPARETVLIEVEEARRSGVLLTVDGQVTEPLESGDRIYISRASSPALLIASGRNAFYEALKNKFFWMTSPPAAGGPHA